LLTSSELSWPVLEVFDRFRCVLAKKAKDFWVLFLLLTGQNVDRPVAVHFGTERFFKRHIAVGCCLFSSASNCFCQQLLNRTQFFSNALAFSSVSLQEGNFTYWKILCVILCNRS
jgi:hypothetical protein